MKKYLVVLLLAGCGTNATWTKSGATNADLQKDLSACQAGHTGLAFGFVGASMSEVALEKCMNERGWIGKYPENQPPK